MPLLSENMANAAAAFWHRGRSVERAGYAIGLLLILSGLLHAFILTASGGSWTGPVSLRKAASFGLSFGVTLISITWVSSFLRMRERSRTLLLGAFTVACVVETALVSMQAWRGVPSHYNVATPFDASVARTLAAGGFAIIAIVITLTSVAFRENPAVPPSLRLAIRGGFAALVASLTVGALMIAKGMRLVFAGHAQAAYATGGSLKPSHAVTMHAILLLPVLAWLLSFVEWPEARRVQVVRLAIVAYAVVAAGVIVANAAGLL